MQKIPLRTLGRNGPTVSAIGLGAMGKFFLLTLVLPYRLAVGISAFYGSTDKDEAIKALTYAADRGMTFWDTADIYGNSGAPFLFKYFCVP